MSARGLSGILPYSPRQFLTDEGSPHSVAIRLLSSISSQPHLPDPQRGEDVARCRSVSRQVRFGGPASPARPSSSARRFRRQRDSHGGGQSATLEDDAVTRAGEVPAQRGAALGLAASRSRSPVPEALHTRPRSPADSASPMLNADGSRSWPTANSNVRRRANGRERRRMLLKGTRNLNERQSRAAARQAVGIIEWQELGRITERHASFRPPV